MNIYNDSIKENNIKLSEDPKKILNDKDLTSKLKLMKKGPKTAKEILYDFDKNILGVLQRNDEPYIFDDKELKEFKKILG